jgi:hypothetical protein
MIKVDTGFTIVAGNGRTDLIATYTSELEEMSSVSICRLSSYT